MDPKFHFVASHRWPLFRARRRTLTPLALLVGICCALLVVKLAAFVRDSESGQPGIASILALYSALILAVLSASAFLFVVWLQKSSPLFDDFSVDANGILVAPRFATPFKVPWNRVERVEISTSAARCVTQIVMSTDLRPDGIYLLPAFLLDARGKPGSCSDLTAVAALIRTEIPERVWELRI